MKKLVISEDVVKRYRMSLAEVFACLLVSESSDPKGIIDELIDKRLLYETADPETGEALILMHTTTKSNVQGLLLDSKKELPKSKDLEELYYKLAELFPKGTRPGTSSTYWRGNKKDTIKKLQLFIDEYGKYTEDQIYEATKHYVNKHAVDKTYMRTLPYFIGKFGNSDLATVLENMDSEGESISNFDTGTLV